MTLEEPRCVLRVVHGDCIGGQSTYSACAELFFNVEINEVKLSDLRGKNLLAPTKQHPAQQLTGGMLLHATSSSMRHDGDGCTRVKVCATCADLKRDKTPAMSLANGMWIGDVPLELKILTLPERVLVARFFPAAYIVKLYPKKKGARYWASEGQHHALRGNVSMYRVNTDQIAHLASSNVMPPSPTILAATVGVTFIRPPNYLQKTMPGFLRVNNFRVRGALVWLKNICWSIPPSRAMLICSRIEKNEEKKKGRCLEKRLSVPTVTIRFPFVAH